jgi:hypothetical protein
MYSRLFGRPENKSYQSHAVNLSRLTYVSLFENDHQVCVALVYRECNTYGETLGNIGRISETYGFFLLSTVICCRENKCSQMCCSPSTFGNAYFCFYLLVDLFCRAVVLSGDSTSARQDEDTFSSGNRRKNQSLPPI